MMDWGGAIYRVSSEYPPPQPVLYCNPPPQPTGYHLPTQHTFSQHVMIQQVPHNQITSYYQYRWILLWECYYGNVAMRVLVWDVMSCCYMGCYYDYAWRAICTPPPPLTISTPHSFFPILRPPPPPSSCFSCPLCSTSSSSPRNHMSGPLWRP